MDINIFQLIEGARKARGLTVIIDVFRAFTVEPYIFSRGADSIMAVGDIDLAYRLKNENHEYILVGEREEKKMPGFDYGNSPSEVMNIDFIRKTIVHTTSAGTQGIVNAEGADEIITGSFVNADAIAKYIQSRQPDLVSLVCMGYSANYPTEEDTFCAEYIKNLLEGRSNDFETMKNTIRNTSGKRFFEAEKQGHAPEKDFYLCMQTGVFDFIIRVVKQSEGIYKCQRIDV